MNNERISFMVVVTLSGVLLLSVGGQILLASLGKPADVTLVAVIMGALGSLTGILVPIGKNSNGPQQPSSNGEQSRR